MDISETAAASGLKINKYKDTTGSFLQNFVCKL